MTLHTTRLLLEVRTSAETLPAELLDAIEHAITYADSNRELGVLCTTRVSLLDAATAMSAALLADIDGYLARQPTEEPDRADHADDHADDAYGAELGAWEVAQAIRNIIAKHRYDAYVAHCRKFNLDALTFERWQAIQGATAGEAAQQPSRVVG